MKNPVIGISGSLIIDEGGMFPGYQRAYVNYDYILSVIQANGIPIIIPFNEDKEIIKSQIDQLDGLILSGGHDLTPIYYGKESSQKLGGIFPERDTFDMKLLQFAEERQLPILGICRGMQIINAYHGGTICQDLSEYKNGKTLKHDQGERSSLETHNIQIMTGSKLSEILKKENVMVNSFHHQILEDVPGILDITACSSDGVVEAIENKMYGWEIGVQWHPEMLHAKNKDMQRIFSALVKQAKNKECTI